MLLSIAALIVGLLIGWAIRGRRSATADSETDWKTRLAARDRDLASLREEVADLTVRLEGTGIPVAPNLDIDVDELMERLETAEDEVRRLQSQDRPIGDTELAHRLESLEAELASAHSQLCPDPTVHETSMRVRPAAAVPTTNGSASETPRDQVAEGDDLTRITGIGDGLASVLRGMGITTYEAVMEMTDDQLAELDGLFDGIAATAARDGWVASAKELIETERV